MSSNMALLAIGMVVAGRVTDPVGPRWMWGAAATLSAAAAIVGFALSRGAGVDRPRPRELDLEPDVQAAGEPTKTHV
jgi:MFS family permease